MISTILSQKLAFSPLPYFTYQHLPKYPHQENLKIFLLPQPDIQLIMSCLLGFLNNLMNPSHFFIYPSPQALPLLLYPKTPHSHLSPLLMQEGPNWFISTNLALVQSIFQPPYQHDSCKMSMRSCHSASPCIQHPVNSLNVVYKVFCLVSYLFPPPDLYCFSLCFSGYFLLSLQFSVYVSLSLRCLSQPIPHSLCLSHFPWV